ncbi:hypothetical protein M758_UG010400 [Ceratodon purpureus]|nr:hypothetical protein M758_UG010400 [Ceratodon purpureus]
MSLMQPPKVDASPNEKFVSSESISIHEEHQHLIEGGGCWKERSCVCQALQLTRDHVFPVLLLKHISSMILHSRRCYSI